MVALACDSKGILITIGNFRHSRQPIGFLHLIPTITTCRPSSTKGLLSTFSETTGGPASLLKSKFLLQTNYIKFMNKLDFGFSHSQTT